VLEEIDEVLFPVIKEAQASEWLLQTLAIAERLSIRNDKDKSERIISPVLAEFVLHFEN
jgi:hypothetical protein